MEEQLINNCILDRFINSHEQSYEEFLSTFTHLFKVFIYFSACAEFFWNAIIQKVVTVEFLKSEIEKLSAEIYALEKDGLIIAKKNGHRDSQEEEGKTIQGHKKSLRKSFSASEISNGDKQDRLPERSKEKLMSFPPQTPNENKTVINESWKSGGSDRNGLCLSEGAQVDYYLEKDIGGEPCSAGSFVLPGEVEEIVTCHTPAFEKPVQQKFRTSSVQQPLNNKAQELLGDDVQPFLLDEEFDYDDVTLTPKFSEAELMAMKELSEEKKTGQMLSPAGAEV